MEQVRAEARQAAEKRVQTEVALTAVAVAENIEITSEDVDAEIQRMAKEYDMDEDKIRAVVPTAEIEKELKLTRASKLVYDSAVAVAAEEEKPAKKTAKKTAKKESTEAAEGEEKPKKAPAKKATGAKKGTSKKAEATEETAE